MERIKGFGSSLLSRKLILTVAVGITTVLNAHYKWGMSEGDIMMLVIGAAAYVGVEGARDIIETNKE